MDPMQRVREWERAVEREPDNGELRMLLAAALDDAGHAVEAATAYEAAAVILRRAGRLADAVEATRRATSLAPADPAGRALPALTLGRPAGSTPPSPVASRSPAAAASDSHRASAPTDPGLPVAHLRRATSDPDRTLRGVGPPPPRPIPGPPGVDDPERPAVAIAGDRRAGLHDPMLADLPAPGLDDRSDAEETPELEGPTDPYSKRLPAELAVLTRADRLRHVLARDPLLDSGDEGGAPPDPPGSRTVAATPSGLRARGADGAPSTGHTEDDTEDAGLELARVFDRPFADAVEALAPDGLPIEPPLAVFHELSEDALRTLARHLEYRRFPASTVVVREGEPGDSCFVIGTGSVRVLKRDPHDPGALVDLVHLGPGALFGEMALLFDRRRHATVQTLEASELYEVPRRLLLQLGDAYPDVRPALERLYRDRLVSTLLSTGTFFRPLPVEERGALMARFVSRGVPSGTEIIREGEPGSGLYLVVLGQVEISRRVDGARRALASLGEGAYFGEVSLLGGGLATATVTAVGPVELAHLAPHAFYEVVGTYPALWDELRREAERRLQATQSLLFGVTGVV